MPGEGDEDVGGLDIAMSDSTKVGMIEGVSNLNGDVENAFNAKGLARDEVLERLALKKLHDNEGLIAGVFADFVDRADVRVVEGGSGSSFTKEAFERKLVGDGFGSEKFERDVAIEDGVTRGVNHTHPPTAEFLDDLVVRNRLANHAGAALTRRWKSIWGIVVGVKAEA